MNDPVVLIGAKRTPIGDFLGELSAVSAPSLGSVAIASALKSTSIAPDQIDEVLMGCVLTAGQGQAPARQAALAAGISHNVPCTSINKMCGSGMKSVMLAHDILLAGSSDLVLAGGMENMSKTPYLAEKARQGYRFGHGSLIDHMLLDGLEDAYEKGRLMGEFAEETAKKHDISRVEQDAFAKESLLRAKKANEDGTFAQEIASVNVTGIVGGTKKSASLKKAAIKISKDEHPFRVNVDKIPELRPVFAKEGTVTAANSSAISDGAAALILARASHAKAMGIKPRARIVGHASHSHEPAWFTTAPIGAIQSLLEKTGWQKDSVDLFEINEAFAVVTMVAMKELGLSHDKVNVHGGACALGHPIGASGARILVTLLHALEKYNLRRGIAAICIGGGEATAIAIERDV
ncbi:MAG: acetyl-CoA C-acyltransferase [Alphaproteobacteria bacterium]|jgi:acetyl-CoA C-acetyltransferase|nr:acetyl-CoA C-acyltransferase [Alphaproteobacteria bacterium]MBT5389260.1 acetyl-CoA C-acyltransferase [Alphaproteobacteria bacterium]